MIALTNKNNSLTPLGYRKKIGGNIVGESNLEVCYNIGGNLIKLPKKSNMILNLDPIVFSQNKILSCALDNTPVLKQDNTQLNTLGQLSQNKPDSAYSVDNLAREWNIRNKTKTNFTFDDLTSENKLSISLTAKVPRTTGWEDLIVFMSGHNIRLEWNGTTYVIYPKIGSSDVLSPAIDRTQFFNITITMENNIWNFYQNGVKFGENMNYADGTPNRVYICTRRDTQNTGDYVIKSFRVWKDKLSDDDVMSLCKIDGLL